MSTSPFWSLQDRDERLLADFDLEAVEIRTLAEIVGIAREHEALAGHPFVKLEGARADRLLAEIGALRLDDFLRHDGREIEREHVEERRVGLDSA